MLHMPTPMLMGGEQGKTYADFDTAITALATSGTKPWTQGKFATGGFALKVRSVATNETLETMQGTPYGSWLWTAAPWGRIARHCLPSEALYNAIVAAGHAVYFETYYELQYDATGIDRNGYQSENYGPREDLYLIVIDFRWWDEAAKKAWRYNPRTLSAAVEWAFQ